MNRDAVPGRAVTITMAQKKTLLLLTGVIFFLALAVIIGLALTHGLIVTRGLNRIAVQEIYVMADKGRLYLSIDLDPAAASLKSIRVPLSEITLKVDSALPTDMTISSADTYIWGDRWPWVKMVTITLKTERQKEGFDKLLMPEQVKQLRDDLAKVSAFGVTHAGLLTGGGKIMDD